MTQATNMKLEIKAMNNQYRVLFSDFDELEQETRLYWFEDYASWESAQQRISELHSINGVK